MWNELMAREMQVDFLLPECQGMSLVAFGGEFLVMHPEMCGVEGDGR